MARQNIKRARRIVDHLVSVGDAERLRRFLTAWVGHAAWANSHHLINAMEAHLAELDYKFAS